MYEKSNAVPAGANGRDSMTLAGGDDHPNAYASNDMEKRTSKQDRKGGLIPSGSAGAADIEERAIGVEGDCEFSVYRSRRNVGLMDFASPVDNYHSLEWWQAGMVRVVSGTRSSQ